MTFDKKEAIAKLREAISIREKCEPEYCECDKCSINEPMEFIAHDSGVKIVASACAMLSALEDVCFEPKEYQYKND